MSSPIPTPGGLPEMPGDGMDYMSNPGMVMHVSESQSDSGRFITLHGQGYCMIVKFFENRVDKPKQGPIVGPRHGLAKIKIQFWTGAKQPCVFLLPKSRQKFSTTRSCDSPGFMGESFDIFII